ncbi:hypothetical protein [Streptomyces turgidiscabies]|uniref:Aminomethyltransferase folate-binding domain-containing protein n=1 Tax=Streptomyces turgidiscabies TaxID=85558 RepID=A0ABU0RMH6_9ACTN|nr:hypothetical protein [Streptomyces turgidiscabies]MDQ0933204.1 hypothetical protein [Streptomyces turgidiscabies]
MAGNYWEEAVYSVPPLSALERTSVSPALDWLDLNFQFDGGKIDWRLVRAGHTHWNIDDAQLLTANASRQICERILPGSTVEHVGDGLSPFGVRFSGDDASSVTAALLEIPEHHYFLAEDRAWIVVVSTEGDLDIVDRLNS